MAIETTALQVGDLVELRTVPRGREGRLKVGQQGRVLLGSELMEFGWATVAFTKAGYPCLLRPCHLRLLERGPERADADDDA